MNDKYNSSVAQNDKQAIESEKLKNELSQIGLEKNETESKLEAALKIVWQLETDKKEMTAEINSQSTNLTELNKRCEQYQAVIHNFKEEPKDDIPVSSQIESA